MRRFLTWLWWHLSGRARADRIVRAFVKKFPHRCFVCSFYLYGYWNGFEETWKPPEHNCIERESIT
jgi:hypothetical protein